jgi:hypothetical protein
MATLAELAQAYLNQGLPSISGIFQPQAPTPVTPVEETPVISNTGITPQLLQPMGGGGGNDFNVYNPNPNTTRTSRNYINPFPYDPMDDFGTPDYGYIDPPKEGLAGLFQKYVKNAPLTNILGAGMKAIGGMLPVNRRAILENELLGGGIMLDNIGRVVTDNYNTPEGIMAGYNANKITDETFNKRRSTISKTLKEKYGMTDKEIEDVLAGEYKGDVETDLIGRIDLLNRSQDIFKKRNNFADIILQNELEKRRIEKEKKRIASLPKDVQQYTQPTRSTQQAIREERGDPGSSDYGNPGGTSGAMTDANAGTFCFDPSTPIQMADGSTKEIKNIQLGDDTKGGEVTGVFQFKATDEIHDYKGVTVAGSHYVKEDGRFIMVKDSPMSVKIDKIPVVYSLDTSGRRIFINDIEFADYNGDGIAKGFLANAGVDITGFDTEVLRQVENRLI